ncbi:MAG: hypothetical protein J6Y42_00685, partial [Bacilli bacterium]|nr:hypothetical protein [Bacilli bacterium]
SEYAKVEIIYDVYTKDALPFYYELWQDGNAIARIWISGFKEGNDIKFFNPSIQMNKTDHSLEEIATEAKLYIEDAITSYTEFIRNNLHLEVNDYDNLILYYSGS